MSEGHDTAPSVMDWRREVSEGYEREWHAYRGYVALCLRHGQPGRWLDLGAGLGYFAECCRRYGIPCQAYEGSAFAVAEAKRRCPGLDIEQRDVLQGLPDAEGSVQVVFCNQVIEHLQPTDSLAFLREIRRVLAPDGLLYVGSPSRFNRQQHSEIHTNLLAPRELARLLVAAGFSEVWPANYPRALPLPAPLGKLLAGGLFLLAPLDRLSISANAMAFARDDGSPPTVRGARYFHLRRMLTW